MRFRIPALLLSLVFISFSASAFDELNCQAIAPRSINNNLLLDTPTKSAQIYFIKNSSKQSVWIDHPAKKHMNAGWSTFLTPNHWSALALENKKSFALSCALISPGKVTSLNCATTLSVCVPKGIEFPTRMKNRNFWIAENKKSLADVVGVINLRKISIE